MKKKLTSASHWTTAVAVVATVAAVFGGQAALAGIVDTKHNLGSQQTKAGANKFSTTGEICVFCHTPHGADTSAKMPLWNRSASTGITYTTYNSLGTLSLDGGTAAVGSTSVACLSCHDGVQAMNTVINAPGSGLTGSTAWQAGITAGTGWGGDNQTNGKMTGLAAVATDADSLKNDHPIGIQYAGGPSGATIPAAPNDYSTFKDPDFKKANSATLSGQQVWWVETNADDTRQKTDLPLYARPAGTALAFTDTTKNGATTIVQPFVECASCHDPHSSNATFLRVENTNSAVCLACHDK